MINIKVIELFAGVGGFRLGLDAASNRKVSFDTVWSSQWEPGMKTQHASGIYKRQFGLDGHSCEDIQVVVDKKFQEIKNHDMLVGGFPCQDYSVARTKSQAAGLEGKKGVLWWAIHGILEKKGSKAPSFLMLENVDRLLKSPSSQRGRDFAIMLASLADLGYAVEWRVVNAAEYGFAQRRRRVFILGYKKNTKLHKNIKKSDKIKWLKKDGVIAKAFPVRNDFDDVDEFDINGDLASITNHFSERGPSQSPFENSGVMIDRHVWTKKTSYKYSGVQKVLRDILVDEKDVPKEFFLDEKKDLEKWSRLKGAKKEQRTTKSGHIYNYSEGAMTFPDNLDKPSRTIVTGEGGVGPSRFKHVVMTETGKLRRLTPVELERLNMFPDNFTQLMDDGRKVSDTRRAFIMGNALVVGVIERLAKSLRSFIE